MELLSIGKFAKVVGVTTTTLRQIDIISDIGSSINYNKKRLQELISKINNQEIDKVVVLYKDRLIGFGFN